MQVWQHAGRLQCSFGSVCCATKKAHSRLLFGAYDGCHLLEDASNLLFIFTGLFHPSLSLTPNCATRIGRDIRVQRVQSSYLALELERSFMSYVWHKFARENILASFIKIILALWWALDFHGATLQSCAIIPRVVHPHRTLYFYDIRQLHL